MSCRELRYRAITTKFSGSRDGPDIKQIWAWSSKAEHVSCLPKDRKTILYRKERLIKDVSFSFKQGWERQSQWLHGNAKDEKSGKEDASRGVSCSRYKSIMTANFGAECMMELVRSSRVLSRLSM